MNTYEKIKAIRTRILWFAGEGMVYASWTPKFAISRLRELPDFSNKNQEKLLMLDDLNLTAAQLDELGFGKWDESPMRLIPIWLLPFLPDEIETVDIFGLKATMKKSEIDNDNRFGYLAQGVFPID